VSFSALDTSFRVLSAPQLPAQKSARKRNGSTPLMIAVFLISFSFLIDSYLECYDLCRGGRRHIAERDRNRVGGRSSHITRIVILRVSPRRSGQSESARL